MLQSYPAVNWPQLSANKSHCATLRRTHRIPRIWITTTTSPTTAPATRAYSSSPHQQLASTTARIQLTAAISSCSSVHRRSALYIKIQKQLQPTEMRPVWGYKSAIKNKTTTAVQLIEWQHHISYACQCVNTYTPTANIRILLLSEWLKHLYSKCIV
jgi:hypothetical protein